MSTLPPPRSRHGTLLAVSMMKDEAPFLLEWVAHHLAVGFTALLVYTNDCTDGTVEMLQRLQALGLAHHRPNRIPAGVKPQPSAIAHAQAEPLVAAADWVMLFDADEFLAISHPAGHLDGLLDDVVARGANGLVVTWRIFGSAGVVDWSRAPVTEQFTRAAPRDWNKGWGVKTLFRFDPEHWKLGIHRPAIRNKHLKGGFPASVRWLNGSGRPMEDYFKFRGWRSIRRTLGYDWAQMNHYAVKSVEAFALRRLRGNVNLKADKYDAGYWALQDRNEVADTAILRHAPERARIMAALLADPVLAELHEAAQARAEARLAALRGTPEYQALKARLLAAAEVPIAAVEAAPPRPRDPARIAAQMQRAGTGGGPAAAPPPPAAGPASPYVLGPVALGEPDWCDNGGVLLPADPGLFSAAALAAVRAGKFERRAARGLAAALDGAQRVLDLGCGVALPALRAAQAGSATRWMLHDARPGMAAALTAVLARNGLAGDPRLRVVSGPLVLEGDPPAAAGGLLACLRDFQPQALRLGAGAGFAPARLAALAQAPEGLHRVLPPFESADQAARLRQAVTAPLAQAGFAEAAAAGGSLVFTRRRAP